MYFSFNYKSDINPIYKHFIIKNNLRTIDFMLNKSLLLVKLDEMIYLNNRIIDDIYNIT